MFPDSMNPNLSAAQFGNTNSGSDTVGIGPLGSYGNGSVMGAGAGGFSPSVGNPVI